MQSDPITAIMARESTNRLLTETKPQKVRRPRRTAALVLQRAAHRLDPYVAAAPKVNLGR